MKKWKNILMCVALGGALVSCVDLDIPPKNIMTNEDIYNDGLHGWFVQSSADGRLQYG